MRDILLDIIDTVCSSSKKDPFKSSKDDTVNGDSKMSTPINQNLNITEVSIPGGKIHFFYKKLKTSFFKGTVNETKECLDSVLTKIVELTFTIYQLLDEALKKHLK